MRYLFLVPLVALLAGCQNMPSMEYCQHVQYTRDGNSIHVEADCLAPVGTGVPVVPKM